MHTRLTDLLGIEHPVMLAGMGGVSYAELAAAVSAAGGFGCLGASTMGNEKMVAEMAAVRAATDKPFGVDLLTAMPGGMTEQVEMVIEGGATAFVAGLGVPTEVVDLCHRHACVVVSMCGKVDHAVRAVEAGATSSWPRAPRPVGTPGRWPPSPSSPRSSTPSATACPVVAAGGIFDGRGLAAALSLGADGIWVGTRFIATPEARGVLGYKDKLLASREDQTTVSRAYSGKTMRVVRNAVHRLLRRPPRRAQEVPRAARRLLRQRDDAPRAATPSPKGSTSTGSATRPARAWVPSPSSCRRASSCADSWPRPRSALDRLAALR